VTDNEHDDRADWQSTPPSTGGIHRPAGSVGSSSWSRWTLGVAVLASVSLLAGALLFWRYENAAASNPPPVALPGPWEPPSAPAGDESVSGLDDPASVPPTSARGTTPPPRQRSTPPTTKPTTRPPTTSPTPGRPLGPNLSRDGDFDADGSSKVDGTSFNDVRDGSRATFWSPLGSTGEVSVKSDDSFTVGRVIIREASGGGTIRLWRLRDHDSGALLATGTTARDVAFRPTSLEKVTLEILSATGTPRVAEFETYAG
jgi:hypothetical protein